MELKNIKLTISYDGSDYSGWQRQKDKKTIQGIIEEAIRKITGETDLKLYGSGRTDAGVHAIGQVANFKTRSNIPIDRWPLILNNLLPRDIRIKFAKKVDNDFHARYDAKSKVYKYYIMNKLTKSKLFTAKDTFLSRYCYYVNDSLDIEKMKKTAQYLIGNHDFSALSCLNQNKNKLPKDRVRNIKHITIVKRGKLVSFTIEADAFLYKMARIIVGTLIDFSRNKREPEEIREILKNRDNQKSGNVVPANGLYLVKIKYK
jgi:tRNA pseudouridine38-40 synthase